VPLLFLITCTQNPPCFYLVCFLLITNQIFVVKKPEYFKNYLFYVWQQVVPTPTPGIAGEPELILDPPEVIWCQIDRMLVSRLIYVYMQTRFVFSLIWMWIWNVCQNSCWLCFFFSFSLTTLYTPYLFIIYFFLVHLA